MGSAALGASTDVKTPDNTVGTDVPVQTRSQRFSSAHHGDFGPVTGREPEWKLTPVEALRALIDGPLNGGRYDMSLSDTVGVNAQWMAAEKLERGFAGLAEDRASANAWESTHDVFVVELDENVTDTVVLSRESFGKDARAAHTVVRVLPNAHATLLIISAGDALLAENLEFDISESASLHVVVTGEWNAGATQYAHHFARVGKGGSLTHVVVSLGGDVVVVNPSVQLVGEGAEAHLLGAYFADSTQHLEHRVFVHHQGPRTVSRVTYKGALHGKGARTVWIGDVLIGSDAVGTDSYEQNRNLVLSEGTRADSIPNLEIKTGDINGAGHASATGRLNDEQLFYLQSRGISETDARRLVVIGFLVEVVSRINDEALAARITEKIRTKLSATEGDL